MKKRPVYFLIGLLTVGVMAPAANAQNTQQDKPFYVGGKVGVMDADIGGYDNATNLGINLGYNLYSGPNGDWAVEGEFTTSINDGELSGGGEWDTDTWAAYGVYRSPAHIYFKGKAGIHRQDIKRAGGTVGSIPNADDTTFAVGAGVGWRVDQSSGFELEYTAASDELNFISLGYVQHF